MNKTWVLIKREFLIRVKNKGFIIGTFALPVLIVVIMGIQIAVQSMGAREKKTLALIDLTGEVGPAYTAYMDENFRDDRKVPLYTFETVTTVPESLAAVTARYSLLVQQEKLSALIILPADIFLTSQFELHARNISNMEFNAALERSLSRVVSDLRLAESGLDQELVRKLTQRMDLKTFKVSEAGTKEESGFATWGISYAMMFILYMALIFYGQFVMRGVYEDKNSRVMEVVLSSVRADQLMAGKIIGIGGAGLLQFLIWALFVALASAYGMTMMNYFAPGAGDFPLPTISFSVYLFFFIFFLLGYFIYATLYATLGSMVNDEADPEPAVAGDHADRARLSLHVLRPQQSQQHSGCHPLPHPLLHSAADVFTALCRRRADVAGAPQRGADDRLDHRPDLVHRTDFPGRHFDVW